MHYYYHLFYSVLIMRTVHSWSFLSMFQASRPLSTKKVNSSHAHSLLQR
jgi:hypothetical protein